MNAAILMAMASAAFAQTTTDAGTKAILQKAMAAYQFQFRGVD